MNDEAHRLLEEALHLSQEDRAQLASELLASVDGAPEPDAEAAWALEIERRARKALADPSEALDWQTIRERIQKDRLG